MMTPKLSVIVANYNNDSFLPDCLDSILNQTYKQLEIIIYDDRSEDNSVETIKEYKRRHQDIINDIHSSVNRGVAKTRHEAIVQSKGEYITTLDSDDYYYDTQKLEKEMDLVLNHKMRTGKNIIAYSNIVMVNEDKSLISIQGNDENLKQGIIFNDIITRRCMIPRDFVMKREIYFEVGGYDCRFPIYEDWDLKIRLAQKYEFYYSGIKGTAYRRSGKGLSYCPIPQHIKWIKKIFKKNMILIPNIERKEIREKFKGFIKMKRDNHLKKKGKKR